MESQISSTSPNPSNPVNVSQALSNGDVTLSPGHSQVQFTTNTPIGVFPEHNPTSAQTAQAPQQPQQPEAAKPVTRGVIPNVSLQDIASSTQQATQATTTEPPTQTQATQEEQNTAKKAKAQAKVIESLDLNALQTELAENGGRLNPKTHADLINKLESVGIPGSIIDTVIENQQSAQEHFNSRVEKLFGGQDKIQEALQWAGQNLSQTEIDTFNKQVQTPTSQKRAYELCEWLHDQWSKEQPLQGKPLSASNVTPAAAGGMFHSLEEISKAQSSQEYKTSEVYRKQVASRIQASIQAGTLK